MFNNFTLNHCKNIYTITSSSNRITTWCESGTLSGYPQYLQYPCTPSTPGTPSSSNTLVPSVPSVPPRPYDCGDQLKSVFLHGFWPIMLLLLYHQCIWVIRWCCLNYKSIMSLLRRFKRLAWFSQVAKLRKSSNLVENFYNASETMMSKMEEILHYIHAKFCYYRACKANFTRWWWGTSNPYSPCSPSCRMTKTLRPKNLTGLNFHGSSPVANKWYISISQ